MATSPSSINRDAGRNQGARVVCCQEPSGLGTWDLGTWDLGLGTWELGDLGTWDLGLGNLGLGTWDLGLGTLGLGTLGLGTWNLGLGTWDLELGKLGTWNLETWKLGNDPNKTSFFRVAAPRPFWSLFPPLGGGTPLTFSTTTGLVRARG